MKLRLPVLLTALALAGGSGAQPAFLPYAARSQFLLTPAGSTSTGLQGYVNPALLSCASQPELQLGWSDGSGGLPNTWGAFAGLSHVGAGMVHQDLPGPDRTELRLGLALGDRRASLGLAYGRADGVGASRRRHDLVAMGALLRPWRYSSVGLILNTTPSASAREGTLDLALRPLGDERLTLFGDFARANPEAGGASTWSAGAAWTAVPGVVLTGRYFDNRTASFGLEVGLGQLGLSAQSRLDADRHRSQAIYTLRIGPYERSALRDLAGPRRRYLRLELSGPLRHRRIAVFDQRPTLLDLLRLIDRVAADPTIGGVALDASGMELDAEMAWELRERLQELRKAGKGVVAYVDRATQWEYYLVSVADRVVLDPAGLVALPGMVAGQTYLKGALDRLGIGFEEWRYSEYKSVLEPYARSGMSEADRRQWQALLDDFYDVVRGDVCAARRLGPEEFDRLVEEEALFLPAAARERKLVDRLGRWDEVESAIAEVEGSERVLVEPDDCPAARELGWGEQPRIAVVYALGLCDMEEGIRARRLVEELKSLGEDPSVAAVVLRVDSPGGDVLPSDLVSGAVEDCRRAKPVVVSQGSVAASGGYWLSMHADAIVAAPNTLTGSIGVIGGWLYDQGFKGKLGLSTDHVQVGRHADLEFGLPVPLIGLQLADRNLTEEERQRVEQSLRTLYTEFVNQVARGRRLSPEAVEAVAQGRVWSGRAAQAHGLVDVLGGLQTAIALARDQAGLRSDQPVQLLEVPRPSLFDRDVFRPAAPGLDPGGRAVSSYLRFRARHNGQPLVLLPAALLDPLQLPP